MQILSSLALYNCNLAWMTTWTRWNRFKVTSSWLDLLTLKSYKLLASPLYKWSCIVFYLLKRVLLLVSRSPRNSLTHLAKTHRQDFQDSYLRMESLTNESLLRFTRNLSRLYIFVLVFSFEWIIFMVLRTRTPMIVWGSHEILRDSVVTLSAPLWCGHTRLRVLLHRVSSDRCSICFVLCERVDGMQHLKTRPTTEGNATWRLDTDGTIDYRCAEGRFSLSARGMTILNSPSLSSSKTEVRNGMKSWKARLLLSAERQEAMGGL